MMSTKSDYTEAEWDLLRTAVLEAGAVMVALEPGGMVKETLAVFRALDEAAELHAENPLIVALTEVSVEEEEDKTAEEAPSPDTTEPLPAGDLETNKQAMLQRLTQAVSLLQTKGSEREVDAYRELVVEVAVKTAAATKKGGFLGIGGERVDRLELQLIAEIKKAVGYFD